MKKKILLTIGALLVLVGLLYWQTSGAQSDGEIHIEVTENNVQSIETTASFETGDTLYDVLDQTFDIETSNAFSQYGRTLLVIEDIETDFTNTFFHISIDGSPANRGIDHIELIDGATYRFEVRGVE